MLTCCRNIMRKILNALSKYIGITWEVAKYFSSVNELFPHNGIGDISVDNYAIKSLVDYKLLFSDIDNKRVGEASPDTIYFYNNTPSHIKEVLGDVPIIIVLRDPVKRAFSAFMYLKRDSREHLSFRDGLIAEDKRLNIDDIV